MSTTSNPLTDPQPQPSSSVPNASQPDAHRCADESRRQRAAHLLELGYSDAKTRKTLRDEFNDCYKSDEQVYADVHAVKTAKKAKSSPPAASTSSQAERTLSPQEKEQLKNQLRAWAYKGAPLESFPSDQYGSNNVRNEIKAFWTSGAVGSNGDRYFKISNELFRGSLKTAGDGTTTRQLERLTNFAVETMRRVIYDDGVSHEVTFEIDVAFKGQKYEQRSLQNADFHKMEWPMYLIDPAAVRFTHFAHEAQVAIQLTATHLPERRIHTHTGWIERTKNQGNGEVEIQHFYLHANGAIGAKGTKQDIKAEPRTKAVRQIALPGPPSGEAEKQAIRASLKFLELGSDVIVMPMYAGVMRAPLPKPTLTIWELGPTGRFKTAVGLLCMQHYGAEFTEENISHWNDTDNRDLFVLYEAKDAPWLIDDYVPEASGKDRERQDRKVDNVVRGVANQAGRGRLNRNGTPQPERPPRALLLATGEDRSGGHSKAARTIFIRFPQEAINVERLTTAQRDAAAGLYATATAGYLKWLAPQYEQVTKYIDQRIAKLRPLFEVDGRHKKTVTNLASLAVGFEMFLKYAKDVQALSQSEADQLWERFVAAMKQVGAEQDGYQKTEDPITEAIQTLKEARSSGRIHLLGQTDDGIKVAPNPGAIVIGQLDSDDSWMCIPSKLFSTLEQLYREQGKTFPKTKDEFLRELKERGVTETSDGRITKRASRHWSSADDTRPWIVYFPARVFADDEADE